MTKVKVKNFQSIGEANLSIEGFTVIVGKNNLGKSAIIRALNAALSNQSGTEYIRNGQKQTEVRIDRDNLNIKWVKGATSAYTVNGESFTKLNRSIPQPIIDAGFKKLEIADQKITPLVASQFDELFLLDKPGTIIADVLSFMYELDIISKADDLCQKELRSIKSLLKTRVSDFVDIKEQLDKFEGFEELKKDFEKVKEDSHICQKLENEIQEITDYNNRLSQITLRVNNLKDIKNIEIPPYSNIENDYNEIIQLINWDEDYKESIKKLKNLKYIHDINIPNIKETEIQVSDLEYISRNEQILISISQKINQSELLINTVDLSILNTASIDSILNEINDIIQYDNTLKETLSNARNLRDNLKDINENLLKLKEEEDTVKVCPLCKKPI